MSANKPIRMPADYKGLKMRIQSSKVLGDEMKALGSIPQVMAFSEVYQALQTGVVDGTENPPSNFYTQKMHEVQKYLTLSNHHYLAYAVIVNKKFWDGLPADIRKILEGAMADATKYADDIAKQENEDALEAVRKSGRTEIITLTPAEKLEWKRALIKVHKESESRVGKDLIQSIYKVTGFDPNKL
jgi:C4-dicarboxylate-binding protein DctP